MAGLGEDADAGKPVTVRCESSKGAIELEVMPRWAPEGAKRFLDLVRLGYYSDIALFRVNPWIVQFGAIKTDTPGPWRELIEPGRHHLPTIPDDPPTDCGGSCTRESLFDGAVSYAGGGVNSRSAQIFIVHHRGKSQPLGKSPWEVPFANVTKGLDSVVRRWHSEYQEEVSQVRIFQDGNDYVRRHFPDLDFLASCAIVTPEPGSDSGTEAEAGTDSETRFGGPALKASGNVPPMWLDPTYVAATAVLCMLVWLLRRRQRKPSHSRR